MNPLVIMVMLQREQQKNMDASRISFCVQTFILVNKTSFRLVKDSDLSPFDVYCLESGSSCCNIQNRIYTETVDALSAGALTKHLLSPSKYDLPCSAALQSCGYKAKLPRNVTPISLHTLHDRSNTLCTTSTAVNHFAVSQDIEKL